MFFLNELLLTNVMKSNWATRIAVALVIKRKIYDIIILNKSVWYDYGNGSVKLKLWTLNRSKNFFKKVFTPLLKFYNKIPCFQNCYFKVINRNKDWRLFDWSDEKTKRQHLNRKTIYFTAQLPNKCMFKVISEETRFSQFMPLFSFYTPWKNQKTRGVLMFAGGREKDYSM